MARREAVILCHDEFDEGRWSKIGSAALLRCWLNQRDDLRTDIATQMRLPAITGILFAATVALGLSVTGCASGGGSSSGSTVPPGGMPPPVPNVSIGAAPPAIINDQFHTGPQTFPTAAGNSPNFGSALPPNGTVFPLLQSGFTTAPTQTLGQTPSGPTTLTFMGTQTTNGQVVGIFELKDSSFGLDVQNIVANGSSVTTSDGRQVVLVVTSLNYTLLGTWGIAPAISGITANHLGFGVSGYQTPNSAVPTSGTATYAGNGQAGTGGAIGTVLTPSGTGTVSPAAVQGQTNLGINFGTGAITGSLTGMTATPAGGGAAVPWNSVTLTGSLSGATISGTTAVSSVPSGNLSFSSAATGYLNGALFGPTGQEIGAIWSLHDPTAQGASALGFLGATKQ
jgi:hypothetical protein